jgi:hypothetical protein
MDEDFANGEDHLLNAIMAARTVEDSDARTELRPGSDLDMEASNLKLVLHMGKPEAAWLARVDVMQAELVMLVESVINRAVFAVVDEKFPTSCCDILEPLWQEQPKSAPDHVSDRLRSHLIIDEAEQKAQPTAESYTPFPNQPENKSVKDHHHSRE